MMKAILVALAFVTASSAFQAVVPIKIDVFVMFRIVGVP
jgi:hypothetical protein